MVHGDSEQVERTSGGARVLIFFYGLLAVAATSRVLYQLIVRAWLGGEPLLPYLISTFSALIYLVACFSFGRRSLWAWRFTVVVCAIELIGVLVVGTLNWRVPSLFPHATVWSNFGAGYLFLPLMLPIAGLAWLLKSKP